MRIPETIFGIIVLITLSFLIWSYRKSKTNRSYTLFYIKLGVGILILGLSWGWFVPMHVGQRGEVPVCKFRFQVFEYTIHDYGGYGNFNDLFFKSKPNKYGSMSFYKRIGGLNEYVGLKDFQEKNNLKTNLHHLDD